MSGPPERYSLAAVSLCGNQSDESHPLAKPLAIVMSRNRATLQCVGSIRSGGAD
jgi:hypothetical protein